MRDETSRILDMEVGWGRREKWVWNWSEVSDRRRDYIRVLRKKKSCKEGGGKRDHSGSDLLTDVG